MTRSCTPAQQATWLAEQAGDVGAANNLPLALELAGPLDVDRLDGAIAAVARRHPALRTTFQEAGGRLVAAVGRAPAATGLPLVAVDTSDAAAAVEGRSRVPLDLLGRPWSVTLLRTAADRHVLLAVFHHAVFDGPSKDIFLEDLASAYAGSLDDAGPPTGATADRPAAAAYWRSALPRVAGALPLPASPHRAPRTVARAEAVRFELDPATTAVLKTTARRCGVSLFVLLLAAVQLLQWLHAGRRAGTIATAMPLGTRSAGQERAIGMFVNEVPACSEPEAATRFDRFAAGLAAEVGRLSDLRGFPYELAVRELAPGTDPRALHPGTRVSYWRSERPDPELPGLELRADRRLPVFGRPATCLRFLERAGGIVAGLEHDTAVLHPAGAERMVAQLRQILREVAEDPGVRLGEIGGVPAAERHTMLVDWNRTAVAHRPGDVLELLAERARRHPDRIAAQFGQERLTFAELDERSGGLAAALAERGCGPGRPIGLHLERSLDLLAAVLAIFKCGAAFVPLDPRYPRDRLAYMLADSGAAALLTRRGATGGPAPPVPELYLEDLLGRPGRILRARRLRAADPAYVIYTSGSTGRPKGVVLHHGGLLNLLHTMVEAPAIGTDDVFLAITTLSFDIGAAELLAPLLAGARVVIAPSGAPANGEAMVALLESSGATVAFATPSTWRLVVAAGWRGGQKVLVGGEPLTRDLAARLVERAAEVWNVYGPTETTIFSTRGRIEDPEAISIGRPVANTTLYLLDDAGCVAPLGAPAELCIGGAGVAGGYLNRDELTAERFPPDRFAGGAARLYRTGDLARYRDDGTVEFLGRRDDQVKVRGNRVELGEVEAALAEHPGVQAAAVKADGASSSDVRLVAYYVAAAGGVEPARLGAWTAERLPGFMVPSAFVALEALPQTPNGKLDRSRLPAPPAAAAPTSATAPRNALERVVGEVWSEVLGRPALDVHEDFFRAGGHSLLAAEVVALTRERLGRHVPMRLIFDAPTIAGMAARLEAAAETAAAGLEPLPRVAAPRP